MANICDNKFLISCENEEVLKHINDKLEKLFEDKLEGEIVYGDETIIEGYFGSSWNFPDEIFDDFFNPENTGWNYTNYTIEKMIDKLIV